MPRTLARIGSLIHAFHFSMRGSGFFPGLASSGTYHSRGKAVTTLSRSGAESPSGRSPPCEVDVPPWGRDDVSSLGNERQLCHPRGGVDVLARASRPRAAASRGRATRPHLSRSTPCAHKPCHVHGRGTLVARSPQGARCQVPQSTPAAEGSSPLSGATETWPDVPDSRPAGHPHHNVSESVPLTEAP